MRLRGFAGLFVVLLALNSGPTFGQGTLPADVSAVKQGDGWRLADAKGMTLYLYESDEKGSGKSACNAACAKAWPPLLVSSETAATSGDWSVIARDDGRRQWAFRGKPVYRYGKEAYAGGTFGDGGSWSIAFQPIPMPPGVTIGKTVKGRVLTSATGLTLYTRGKGSACAGACLETWTPVAAPWMALPVGDFSVVARDDGIYQWAFKGAPLFQYVKDIKPGDTKGEGAEKAWTSVLLEPATPFPSWVKVEGSDGGDLLADANGMTIYAYDADRNALVKARGEDCFGECLTSSWAPISASEEAPPLGNWSVVKNADGTLQWAYQGKPLYTSRSETRPGDLSGIMLRRARAWRPIMLSLPSIQGASPNG